MKTIGLIGGTGWQSTLEYYKLLNETVSENLGNNHSARLVLISLDFAEIEEYIKMKTFDAIEKILVEAAIKLENAGAACVLLCANTLHMFFDKVKKNVSIPVISIIDATIKQVERQNCRSVVLLGTKATMTMDFYKGKFTDRGINIIIPKPSELGLVHNIIFEELFRGQVNPESKIRLKEITESLIKQGAQGLILGCTELPLILTQNDFSVPVFDTTRIHVNAALDYCL